MGDPDTNKDLFKKENKSKFSIGLSYALKGIFVFFKDGRNAKIHLAASILVIFAGICFRITTEEWLWISVAITLVFVTEMINTSIELLCDLVAPNKNENAGKLKDIAAGAVLIAAFFALLVAGIIFWSYIFG